MNRLRQLKRLSISNRDCRNCDENDFKLRAIDNIEKTDLEGEI